MTSELDIPTVIGDSESGRFFLKGILRDELQKPGKTCQQANQGWCCCRVFYWLGWLDINPAVGFKGFV